MSTPPTSNHQSSRPQPSPSVSRRDHLEALARWAGIYWEVSSMHDTAENAIHVAADLKDEVERLRGIVSHQDAKLVEGSAHETSGDLDLVLTRGAEVRELRAEVEQLRVTLDCILTDRVILFEGAFYQMAETNEPNPDCGWYSFPTLPSAAYQARDRIHRATVKASTDDSKCGA